MKAALLLVACVGCVEATPEPWDLAQDRLLAVRMSPPGLASGEIAQIDALVAHASGPTTVEVPRGATAVGSELFTAVHYNLDHWEIEAPMLDAPVPLEVTLQFPGSLYATKSIVLGEHRDNPAEPVSELLDTLAFTRGTEHTLRVDVDAALRVRWFASCGALDVADAPSVTMRSSEDPCTGEVAVVVRDDAGGVSWRVWPLQVE